MSQSEFELDLEERDKTEVQPAHLRKLFSAIAVHWGLLLWGSLLILVGTGAALCEPRLFGYAIDEAIIPGRWGYLKALTLIFLVLTTVRVCCVIGQAYLFEYLGQKVTQDLRMKLFSHLQRLPVSVFDRNPAGRLMTRVTNDIASLADMFTAGFISMIGNILMVVGILISLLVLDLRLGLIAASVFPILVWISVDLSRRLRVSYRETRSRLSALNAFLAENLMGMKVVHLFNREGLHLARFDRINQWYSEAQVSSIRVFAFIQPAITWASGISMALVIYYGGWATRTQSLKLGVLTAFFSYVLSLFQPIREIADKWNIFLSGLASAERVFSILEWETELTEEECASASSPVLDIRGHIVFENVWFAYQGEHWVLKDFSLDIPAGSSLGIVGHTGSGKTTLISLLMRFYEPQKGRILIDGKDIRSFDKRSLRAALGVIQQDVFLFSGNLEDNITFWNGTPRQSALPETMDTRTELQERGSNFSMGQRQVIAFARVAEMQPQVWILDEATANMDSESEVQLQRRLETSSRGKTSVLIAHRLATVRRCDAIAVLHKGKLLEHGGHEKLIQSGGLYARLYRYQMAVSDRA